MKILKTKNKFFVAIIALVLVSTSSLNFVLQSTFNAYNPVLSEEISPSNHHYPVYNCLILQLNNKTQGNLIARVKILNQTTGERELNRPLLEQITEDMKELAEKVSNLHEIYLYEYNDSVEPGTLYFLLCTTLDHAKESSEQVISIITDDPLTWWYVANVSFPIIDLARYDICKYGNFDYISTTILGISTGKEIITGNDSTLAYFYERDGIISTPLLYHNETSTTLAVNETFIDPSNFIPNIPFIQVVEQDVKELQDHFWYLYNATLDYLILGLRDFEYNDSITARQLISINIFLNYNISLSHDDQFRLFLLISTIYSHFWYARPGLIIQYGLSVSPPVLQYILITLGFVAILGSVAFLVTRYIKKKK